ncbi:hypothetical protein DM02DRAFT_523383 [Periconia macrospinosa]|uniref:Uncharacterized protein n=1 Tax=Periconia macrospinosa TaxID=97972 RepID=A0A2V1DUY6_9PLEO|nr:hypothetical protein DM02DRAFT_523383 [Periconia macrospinosa]
MAFPLLRLPLELREHIYSYYFRPGDCLETHSASGGHYHFEFALFRVSKQIYAEARTLWRRKFAYFVKLATPWESAVYHISTEGFVPIVAEGRRASMFKEHTFLVEISQPRSLMMPDHSIVLMLDDIAQFTQTWYYSALSYPSLNDSLHLNLAARNPDERGKSADRMEEEHVPLDLQRRLLTPFDKIKGLYSTSFSNFDQSLTNSLLADMAKPHPPVHECLEQCQELLEKGDQLLSITPRTTAAAQSALESYIAAFHAIHILVDGRSRRVLAEAYFHENITVGRFAGQMGPAIRIVLRIRLVSRFVLCYLRLGELGDAAFWGMRSVRIMVEELANEFDDFMAEFVGSTDIGLINARTAMAFALLERSAQDDGETASGDISHDEQRGKWKAELACYEGEELATSKTLWELAGKYLRGLGQEETRKTVTDEAKEFGVEIPEGTMERKKGGSDMDSLSYLSLAGMED